MNIGTQIKRLRIERGYTQVELSELCNLSIRTIQRIENNDVEPTSHSLKSIGKVLNVDLVELKNNNTMKTNPKQSDLWLVLLHFSGIMVFIFPPLLIYLAYKDENELIKEHGKDVLNFQLSIFILMICCGVLPILILPLVKVFAVFAIPIVLVMIVGFYAVIRIIINTINVLNHKPYKYPKLFKFIN